jgi:hypothetical protein
MYVLAKQSLAFHDSFVQSKMINKRVAHVRHHAMMQRYTCLWRGSELGKCCRNQGRRCSHTDVQQGRAPAPKVTANMNNGGVQVKLADLPLFCRSLGTGRR